MTHRSADDFSWGIPRAGLLATSIARPTRRPRCIQQSEAYDIPGWNLLCVFVGGGDSKRDRLIWPGVSLTGLATAGRGSSSYSPIASVLSPVCACRSLRRSHRANPVGQVTSKVALRTIWAGCAAGFASLVPACIDLEPGQAPPSLPPGTLEVVLTGSTAERSLASRGTLSKRGPQFGFLVYTEKLSQSRPSRLGQQQSGLVGLFSM